MTKALLPALAVVLGLAFAPAAQAQNAPATLAVANISTIAQRIQLKKDMDGEMETLSKSLVQQRTEKEADIEKLRKELESYKPESELGRETADKILHKVAELEAFRSFAEQKITMENRLRTMTLYRAVNAAIADYAKAHKILLVLATEDPDLATARTPQELASRMGFHKVLYAEPALDISDAIVEKMNSEAKARPAKTP